MLFTFVRNALKSGRTFATEGDFVRYVNRVVGYMKGKKKTQRTTQAHAAKIIAAYKAGKLNVVS